MIVPARRDWPLQARLRPPTISVVVCAYTEHRWAALCRALKSVFEQSPPPLEVILVVDHNEPLAERAGAAFPAADVILNTEVRGLSGARNAGVNRARADVVAFIDDDAVADPGWLAALTDAYHDPQVVATGGVVAPLWIAPRSAWLPDEFLWVVGCSYRGVPERRVTVRNPIGANMALRRALCVSAGGFNSGLGRVGRTPLGCEETELSIRLRRLKHDAIILHVPTARVRHEVVAERLGFTYFVARCWSEGISKAIVSRLVGVEAALAAERRYVSRTVLTGFWRCLRDVVGGDASGVLRAAALVAGIAVTTAGYVRGTFAHLPERLSDGT